MSSYSYSSPYLLGERAELLAVEHGQGNICTGNRHDGIVYFGDAGGVARQNECLENVGYGIYVVKTADPDVVDNDCYHNTEGNIVDERR